MLIFRKKYFQSSRFTLLLIFLFLSSTGVPTLSKVNNDGLVPIELKLTKYIPSINLEEKGVFLNNATSISIDSVGEIFIANSKEGNIIKFDTNGNFLSKIGCFGQGPGEFEFPGKVFPMNTSLFVLDTLRSCIQIFDKNGMSSNQIRLFRSYSDLYINTKGSIFAVRGSKDVFDFLVDVLDAKGILQFSFGNPIRDIQTPLGMANKVKIAVDKNDDIILIFQTSARLHKYNISGSLISDIQISTESIIKDLNYNKKQFSTIRSGKRVGYHHIIEAIRIVEDAYYILRNGDGRIEILELNNEGKIVRSFYFIVSKDYYAIDFDLIRNPTALAFYILEIAPECRIAVYSTKLGAYSTN